MPLRILLLVICCLAGTAGRTQELYLEHFSVDQGLPSNEVYRIQEDTSGYLWITTDRGIVRYDGYSFEEMPVEGAPAVYPWFGIFLDPSGKIYFFGLKGHIAVYENGRLYVHPHNNRIGMLHGNRMITSFRSGNDSLWISYADLGNFLLLPDGTVISQEEKSGVHLDRNKKFSFHIFNNTTAVGTISLKSIYITWENGRDTDSLQLPVRIPLKLLQWESMCGYDLFLVGGQVLFYKDRELQQRIGLPRNAFSALKIDDRHLLIGFENGGVSLYEVGEAKLTGPKQTWLTGLSITNIIRDFQGGLWFTTIESGLFYAYPTRASFWNGPGKIVFIEERDGRTFVGYRSGLVRIFEHGTMVEETQVPMEGEMHQANYTFNEAGEIVVPLRDVAYTYSNGRWLHGQYSDAIQLPLDKRTLEYVRQHRHSWLSGLSGAEGVLTNRITCMQLDAKGYCWVGTFEGLYLYANDSLKRFQGKNNVFSDRIVGLKELSDGWVAIATLGNGLALYHDGQVKILDKNNGLITPVINDLEVDGDTIWLGTNKGISKVLFTGDSFKVWHYGRGFGLPTLSIHELSVSGGWLYFKWIDRLVAIELNRLSNLLPSEPPAITSVTVNGAVVNIAEKSSFRYNQNEIKIGFNSINPSNGPGQIYRYRLRGSEDVWHTSTERYAVFTTLAPGDYSFEVQVADVMGNFLPYSAIYRFVIRPAFWQQWWFPAAIGLLLLLIAYFIFRARLVSVKNKNRLLLDLAENQQKALVQLINPHFIFNVLNSFSSAVATDDKMNALTIIGRFTKLIRLSIELGRKKRVLLAEEVTVLEKYLELEMMRFPNKFSYELDIAPDINMNKAEVPGMIVQPFVENAIKHGLMHLFNRKGHVVISFRIRNGLIICMVDDNGIGREKAARINRNKKRSHQPAGVEITVRRLQLLHEEKGAQSEYQVVDKKDEKGNSLGTTVIFSIPFKLKND